MECKIAAKHLLPETQNPLALQGQAVEYTEKETAAYIAWQMPFAYASVRKILEEVSSRVPQYQPRSMLDFGSGPGTAVLYAPVLLTILL